jgi:hypothetical protein
MQEYLMILNNLLLLFNFIFDFIKEINRLFLVIKNVKLLKEEFFKIALTIIVRVKKTPGIRFETLQFTLEF